MYERIPLRAVRLPQSTTSMYDRFLGTLQEKLEAGVDRNLICREALRELHTGESRLASLRPSSSEVPWSDNLLLAGFDPRNVTLEAERYGDADPGRFAAAKPLLWLWYAFDRSPLGMNLQFGFQLRALLARFLFRRCGERVRIFPYCEFSFGYNLELGDDVVIHRWVTLDDRAPVSIGSRSSLSDYVALYSHTHDVNEQELVWNRPTIIEEDCRITYHATILAGSIIRRGSMVGAGGLVTSKEVGAGEIWVGFPARKVREKDYYMDATSGERLDIAALREFASRQPAPGALRELRAL